MKEPLVAESHSNAITRRCPVPNGTILQTTLLRNQLYFALECISRPKMKCFEMRCRFGKLLEPYPGLAPWAVVCRPFGAGVCQCILPLLFGNEEISVCGIVTFVTSFALSAHAPFD